MSHRHTSERGVVVPMVAVSLVALLGFTALAVDIGLGAERTRDLQQVADLVAVDVARLFDGRRESDATLQADAETQAMRTASGNDFPVTRTGRGQFALGSTGTMTITLGCWEATRSFQDVCPRDSFIPGELEPPDAVRVAVEDDVDYKFADVIGIRDGSFDRAAVARRLPLNEVRIGSVAAGYQQRFDPINAGAGASGELTAEAHFRALEARLKAAYNVFVGGSTPPGGTGLDVVSYDGLASSDVDMGTVASQAGFGSPEQMADAQVTNGQLFEATARALEAEGNGAAAASVRSFAGNAGFDRNATIVLGSMFETPYGPVDAGYEQGTGTANDPSAARTRINVLDLFTGAAALVNGRNFVSYSFNPNIPGVLNVNVDSFVVEPPQSRYDTVGFTVSTAQMRHQITIEIDGAALGIPGLTAPITLPIVVEAATADGTLSRADCYEPESLSETQVDVVTSLTRLRVGVAQNLQAAAGVPITVNAAAFVKAGGFTLSFLLHIGALTTLLGQDLSGTGDVSLGGGTDSLVFRPLPEPPGAPSQRAMGGVTVNAGAALQAALTTTVNGFPIVDFGRSIERVFNNLGSNVIDPIFHATGMTLGGADVTSRRLNCDAPQLVD